MSGYAVPARVRGRLIWLSTKEYCVLAAVCRRVLDGVRPAVSDGSEGASGAGAAGPDTTLWIDRYVAVLPAGVQDDLRGLLHLVEHLPPLLGQGWARFTRLDPGAQDQVLRTLAGSERALFRQGAQALKSLACLAYYQDPRSFAAISYSGPMV